MLAAFSGAEQVDWHPTQHLVWKDTAIVPVGSRVAPLIDVSTPGDWTLHCHIAEQLEAGMMTVTHVLP